MKNVLRIVLAAAVLTGGLLAVPGKASAYAPIYHDPNGYKEYIIQHESSGRPWVKNYLGCMGLMQACPQTDVWYGNVRLTLPQACPSWPDDVACQLDFFERYKNERYQGSWYNSYLFHLQNNRW